MQRWVDSILPEALETIHAVENKQWQRCGGTWFVGVNALANDATGALGNGEPLSGQAHEFVRKLIVSGLGEGHGTGNADAHLEPSLALDQAQISVCFPGYPAKSSEESANAYRFRVQRDAAHVDGLRRLDDREGRFVMEHHAFILGIPLVKFNEAAAPFVIWEGSHHIIRKALRDRLAGVPAEHWSGEDISDAYQKARAQVFDSCERRVVHATPGEAFVVHRLAVHGVAPWEEGAYSDDVGRVIAYFRPEFDRANRWLDDL